MMLGAQSRFIAVAEDLGELYQLLKDPKLNLSGDKLESDLTSFSAFAMKALDSLNELGKARFNMPWRWRPWSNNYQQFLQQWSMEQFEVGPHYNEESGRRSIEQRKKKITKLQTRLDKVLAVEKQQERELIGVPYDEKLAKQVGSKMVEKQKKDLQAFMALATTPHVIVAPKQNARKVEEANFFERKKKTATAVIQPKLQRQIAEDEMQMSQRHPAERWGVAESSGLFESPP